MALVYGGSGTRPCAVDPPLILAPMAGITDMTYRLLLRRIGGVGLVTMEFVSSEGLTRGNRKTQRLLRFDPAERPLSVQIYGADATRMEVAAERVEEMGVDVCDINMGCPANKVLKGCAGAGLMRDLEKAREIVAACRKALKTTPLTVKFRLGLTDESVNYLELGRICEGEGVSAVALHARTAKQMYTGAADWSRIARLKEAVKIPVVGNGDVATPEDVLAMFRKTGCDAVMCGRATMKNPWIFRQAAELLQGRPYREATLAERRDVILDHFRLIQRDDADAPKAVLGKLRTFTGWYTHGLPNGGELRRRIACLKEAVRIPVVGNGDVATPEDVLAMFRETGCDAVMCGRATMKNPWIFRQAAELLQGRPYREATLAERRDVILDHFRLIQKDDADVPKAVLAKLRTFTGWYTHGLPNGGELRRRIASLESPQAFLDAVEDFFATHAARAAA